MNPVHTFPSYFPKTHSNIILPSATRPPKWPLSFSFSNQNFVFISHLSHASAAGIGPPDLIHIVVCDSINGDEPLTLNRVFKLWFVLYITSFLYGSVFYSSDSMRTARNFSCSVLSFSVLWLKLMCSIVTVISLMGCSAKTLFSSAPCYQICSFIFA